MTAAAAALVDAASHPPFLSLFFFLSLTFGKAVEEVAKGGEQ